MRVTIDDAGHDVLTGGIKHLRVAGGLDGLADFGDFAILNKDRAVLDGAVRNGENGGVFDENHGRGVGGIGGMREKGKAEETEQAEHRGTEKLANQHGKRPHSAPPEADETLFV